MIQIEKNSLKFRNDNTRKSLNIKVQTHPKKNLLNLELLPLAKLISEPYYLKPIEIDFNKRTAKVDMTDYTTSKFSGNYTLKYEHWDLQAFVKYSFPITSGIDLLFRSTQERELPEFMKFINLSNTKDRLELIYQTNHPEKELNVEIKNGIKQSTEKTILAIKEKMAEIKVDVESFNESLTEYTLDLLKERKKKMDLEIQQSNELNDL